ncbi:MAG: DUF1493 family protein [Pseudorhodobacter sp.]
MGLREDILALVLEHSGVKPEKLNPADIFGSSGMEGDGADEFLETFAEEFTVNLDEFRYYFHYIGDEPPTSRRVFPVGSDGKEIPFWPITLDQLVAAAQAGRWQLSYPTHEIRTRWISDHYLAFFVLMVAGFALLIAC